MLPSLGLTFSSKMLSPFLTVFKDRHKLIFFFFPIQHILSLAGPHRIFFTLLVVWANLKYGEIINKAETNLKGRVEDLQKLTSKINL